jgi:hypothetical protein
MEAIISYISSHNHAPDSLSWKLNEVGDAIYVNATVAVLEQLLNTKIVSYQHAFTGLVVHKSSQGYYLPSHIAPLVALVSNLNRFPSLSFTNKKRNVSAFRVKNNNKGTDSNLYTFRMHTVFI